MTFPINTWAPSVTNTSLLICDMVQAPNGSPDALPGLTQVNGVPVSAALEIQSTNGALLNPRLNQDQIDVLTPYPGMQLYNTTEAAIQFYYGGTVDAWVTPLTEAGSGVENDIVVFGSTDGSIVDSGVKLLLNGGNSNLFEGVNSGSSSPGVLSTSNIAYGINVLSSITNGSQRNTIIGIASADDATLALDIIAIGANVLANIDSDAQRIISIGNFSCNLLDDAIDTVDITAVGDHTFFNATSILQSVGIGNNVGRFSNSVDGCTFVGYGVASENNNGQLSDLTAVGTFALQSVSTNSRALTAVGWSALQSATTATHCTAVGYQSAPLLTTGDIATGTSAFGDQALQQATTAISVTAIGTSAGSGYQSYAQCTFLGASADASVNGLTNANAIGYGATVGASNSMVLGQQGTKIGINTSTPQGALHVASVNGGGGIILPIRTTTDTTIAVTFDDYFIISATNDESIFNLPVATADNAGQVFILMHFGATGSPPNPAIRINAAMGQKINNSSNLQVPVGNCSVTIITDGTDWYATAIMNSALL